MAVWNLFFASVVLPLVGIALLANRTRVPVSNWISTFLLALGLTSFGVLAAPWGWFGVPLRMVILALFVFATVVSLIRRPPEEVVPERAIRTMVKVLIGFFFGSVGVGVLRAHAVPPGAIDLGFPLRGGTFLVTHGGSTSAANLHNPHPAQRYAVDIVKLNRAGVRAAGLYPSDVSRYAVFGATVVSPCDGPVIRAVDGLPDLAPPTPDTKNVAGNHVVVRCGDADVWLAHLQRGSVSVRPGAIVRSGAPLARVGNSGNTSEPHLHVHAERNGAGVPARFDGKWLVRNAAIRK
ncbi:MAG TPA: M23 family metallopeptidase [Thermoanaerobaculia bacterium]|nr:M23 family metallopeptidase [Thermoanaerobaculia bacterium]